MPGPPGLHGAQFCCAREGADGAAHPQKPRRSFHLRRAIACADASSHVTGGRSGRECSPTGLRPAGDSGISVACTARQHEAAHAESAMPKHTVSLEDKYSLDESRQLLTSTQAIV